MISLYERFLFLFCSVLFCSVLFVCLFLFCFVFTPNIGLFSKRDSTYKGRSTRGPRPGSIVDLRRSLCFYTVQASWSVDPDLHDCYALSSITRDHIDVDLRSKSCSSIPRSIFSARLDCLL